jgi:hypothetical protein
VYRATKGTLTGFARVGGRAGMKSTVIAELETAIGNYSKAGTERFKADALQKAISAVGNLEGPLTEPWVDQHISGAETKLKVKQIMRTHTQWYTHLLQ